MSTPPQFRLRFEIISLAKLGRGKGLVAEICSASPPNFRPSPLEHLRHIINWQQNGSEQNTDKNTDNNNQGRLN